MATRNRAMVIKGVKVPDKLRFKGKKRTIKEIAEMAGITAEAVIRNWKKNGNLKGVGTRKKGVVPIGLEKCYHTLDKNIPFDKCLLDAGYRSVNQFCKANELSAFLIGCWKKGRICESGAYLAVKPNATVVDEMINGNGFSLSLFKTMTATGCLEYELYPDIFTEEYYNALYKDVADSLPSRVHYDTTADNDDRRRVLMAILKTLPEKYGKAIELICGLGDERFEHTYEEVASIWNVSRERVRQVFVKGIRMMLSPSRRKLLMELCPEWTLKKERTASDVCRDYNKMKGW